MDFRKEMREDIPEEQDIACVAGGQWNGREGT